MNDLCKRALTAATLLVSACGGANATESPSPSASLYDVGNPDVQSKDVWDVVPVWPDYPDEDPGPVPSPPGAPGGNP
jgi:hypothetical protein